ncbi:MAG: DUF5718 family protein [Patulibacter sp.]|nr:DUF5718 family protein [Patulibacter sp.]
MPADAAATLPDLRTVFGFGVAGNFAGHLEQAGEAADFVSVQAASAEAPKGIFPWFVPGAAPADGAAPAELTDAGALDGVPAFLGTFPVAADHVVRPAGDEVNLQIEPEVGVIARVSYDAAGQVTGLAPEAIGAFNDCSIRRAGAAKISHKKNWGPASKGFSQTLLPITDLDPAGPTRTLRLTCFLLRDGELLPYGVDSALPDYSYYGDQLLDWIVDRLNHQTGSPDTPLEPVGDYLRAAGRPDHVLIGIGATRYTPLGESTYLEVGDEAMVAVYDAASVNADAVADALRVGGEAALVGASVLRQRVVAG